LIDAQQTSRTRQAHTRPTHEIAFSLSDDVLHSKSALKALETPGKPFLHHVNHHQPASNEDETRVKPVK
jgi:hypothetical protein